MTTRKEMMRQRKRHNASQRIDRERLATFSDLERDLYLDYLSRAYWDSTICEPADNSQRILDKMRQKQDANNR